MWRWVAPAFEQDYRVVLFDLAGSGGAQASAYDRAESVSQSHDHVNLRFWVQDTGIGIAPDRQPQIFDEYTQADSSISRRFGGTGLGLAITAKLVELQHGRLSVSSEPGRGSVFSFEIPLKGTE